MANGYVKRCSTSPVTQEMQFKTITGEQLTPVGRFIIKKTEKKKKTHAGEGTEKRGPLRTVGAAAVENGVEAPRKVKSRTMT